MILRLLFHVHTRRSLDGWIKPEQIVRFAEQNGLGAVIVTDHHTHLGSQDCASLSAGSVEFPLSAEYRSTAGDVVCAFLTGPVTSREPLEMIAETHAQEGIVILPHPYKGSRFADAVFEQADVIEVFNARCSDEDNARARATAEALGKPMIAGADAHTFAELGLVVNEFEVPEPADWRSVLLTAPRTFRTAKTTVRTIRKSQMVKATRQMRPVKFAKNLIRWMQASPDQTP